MVVGELYALSLLKWSKDTEDELLSWWPRAPWQTWTFFCATFGVTLSLHRGLTPLVVGFYFYIVLAGAVLIVAALALLAWPARRPPSEAAPVPIGAVDLARTSDQPPRSG